MRLGSWETDLGFWQMEEATKSSSDSRHALFGAVASLVPSSSPLSLSIGLFYVQAKEGTLTTRYIGGCILTSKCLMTSSAFAESRCS